LGSTNHCQSAEALTAGDIDQIALADRSPETPARPSARLHAESIAGNDFLIPAIADAQPCWLRSFASPAMSSNNSQITEATTHQIVGSGAIAIGYRHADNVSDGMLIVQREA
jgi:hypothetical protein